MGKKYIKTFDATPLSNNINTREMSHIFAFWLAYGLPNLNLATHFLRNTTILNAREARFPHFAFHEHGAQYTLCASDNNTAKNYEKFDSRITTNHLSNIWVGILFVDEIFFVVFVANSRDELFAFR